MKVGFIKPSKPIQQSPPAKSTQKVKPEIPRVKSEGGVRGIQNDTPETNNIGMVVRELAKDLIEMDEKMLAEPNWKASDRQKYPRRDVDRAE